MQGSSGAAGQRLDVLGFVPAHLLPRQSELARDRRLVDAVSPRLPDGTAKGQPRLGDPLAGRHVGASRGYDSRHRVGHLHIMARACAWPTSMMHDVVDKRNRLRYGCQRHIGCGTIDGPRLRQQGRTALTVGPRLRYEVLQRDKFTCRYCGAFAPVVVLHVDHVVPRKHGGQDKAANLVTACQDCNLGKSAILPPPGIIAEIQEEAARWRREKHGEPDEDDLREMRAYQDALYVLEELPASQVLHSIARAFAAAMPYRPTHSELIRAAGDIAERSLCVAEVPS